MKSVTARVTEKTFEKIESEAEDRDISRAKVIKKRLENATPNKTGITFSKTSAREKTEDLIEDLVEEFRKKLRLSEQIEIAVRLLSHPDIEDPPEMIDAFGEYQAMCGKGILDSTKKQNWIMARDDYFSKRED